jgi:hypothetical protein
MKLPALSTAVSSSLDAANIDGLIAGLNPGRRNILGRELRSLVH